MSNSIGPRSEQRAYLFCLVVKYNVLECESGKGCGWNLHSRRNGLHLKGGTLG